LFDVGSLSECAHSDDVTEVEAAGTQEAMTCRKYGWSAPLLYADQPAVELRQQQQPQQLHQRAEDAAAGSDAVDEQRRHSKYAVAEQRYRR